MNQIENTVVSDLRYYIRVSLKKSNATFSFRCQHGVHNLPNKITAALHLSHVSLLFVENNCTVNS